MTLKILAEQYGISMAQAQQMADAAEAEPDYSDPLEREIAEERKARLALEDRIAQREADEQLQQAVGGLKSQFNLNDDDLRYVVQTAYHMGLGVEMFPTDLQDDGVRQIAGTSASTTRRNRPGKKPRTHDASRPRRRPDS